MFVVHGVIHVFTEYYVLFMNVARGLMHSVSWILQFRYRHPRHDLYFATVEEYERTSKDCLCYIVVPFISSIYG